MTEELFRERLVELFNEFHKEKESSYVSHTANEVAYEWQSSHDLNECIDEVRSDYVDDDGCIVIDVWLHNDEDGFFYYNTTTTPDETSEFHVTDTIFDAVFIGEEIKSDFDITIYQEAVFSGDDVPGTKRTVQEIKTFFDEIDAE